MSPEAVAAVTDAAFEYAQQKQAQPRADALLKCLEQLPDRGAELLMARYSESFRDVAQLAEQIGRSASATYSLLKRLRQILRDCIEQRLESAK